MMKMKRLNKKEETTMIIKRTIEIEADPSIENGNRFEIGDVIGFTLTDGEEVEAMAMKHEKDGTIFTLVDCIEDEQPMQRSGKDIMRDYLNKDLYIRFPEEIRNMMLPFEHGDMLRLMTQKEVFGENYYEADEEDESVEQFEPMKKLRNRIAQQGKDGSKENYEWYWLANQTWLRDVASSTSFAGVSAGGNANYGSASNSLGVRPAFKIRDL